MFQIIKDELKSNHDVTKCDIKMGGTRKLPNAFAETGIYMSITVLKGDLATKQSIFIVDAYIGIAIREVF